MRRNQVDVTQYLWAHCTARQGERREGLEQDGVVNTSVESHWGEATLQRGFRLTLELANTRRKFQADGLEGVDSEAPPMDTLGEPEWTGENNHPGI